ncbi:MAG: hypothetical protein AAFX09_08170 [Pseudomonadota bacterium]
MALIRANDGCAIGGKEPVCNGRDLSLKSHQLAFGVLTASIRPVEPHLPQIGQHGASSGEQCGQGAKITQKSLKLTFDLFFADRLAM